MAAAAAVAVAGAAGCSSATVSPSANSQKTGQQGGPVSAVKSAAGSAVGAASQVGKSSTSRILESLGLRPSGTNYAQYSMMTGHNAGQYSAGDGVEYQWAWNQISGVYEIRWDPAAKWNQPPSDVEHFLRRGSWVELDGFENGQLHAYGNQRVTKEEIGNEDCQQMQTLPTPDHREHYVMWNVPVNGYCLRSSGTVTGTTGGKVKSENFVHTQIWYPPQTCQSKNFGTVQCIRQHESWADNGGKAGQPLRTNLTRDVYFGKGLGPALIIDQQVPSTWHAGLDRVFIY